VSDIAALLEHVRASLRLIEQTITHEAVLGHQETSADIVVLDDTLHLPMSGRQQR
jgi:hypothetical protein